MVLTSLKIKLFIVKTLKPPSTKFHTEPPPVYPYPISSEMYVTKSRIIKNKLFETIHNMQLIIVFVI